MRVSCACVDFRDAEDNGWFDELTLTDTFKRDG